MTLDFLYQDSKLETEALVLPWVLSPLRPKLSCYLLASMWVVLQKSVGDPFLKGAAFFLWNPDLGNQPCLEEKGFRVWDLGFRV